MCSTLQSPRAAKAFSRACAARTWPAPEDADKSNTRGLVFISGEEKRQKVQRPKGNSRRFPGAGRQLLQNAAGNFLRLTKSREIFLKFVIDVLGLGDSELMAENHVAQFDRMRQERVFLQFFQRGCSVVVIHRGLQQMTANKMIVLVWEQRGNAK